MVYILNIETSTKNCSVSLSIDGKTITLKEEATENFSHAEKLHVFIEVILKENNIRFQDLKAISVSKGPGSYTGLRIGVSAVKGLCYALGIPMIAIDTLELLSLQINVNEGVVIPMIDARRMEVYSSVFNCHGIQIREIKAEIIDSNSFKDINEKIHLVGDGATKLKTILTSEKFIFYDKILYPTSDKMSKLAYDKYKAGDFVDVAYFEPYYLKDFVLNK